MSIFFFIWKLLFKDRDFGQVNSADKSSTWSKQEDSIDKRRTMQHFHYRSIDWLRSYFRLSNNSPYTNDRRSTFAAEKVLCSDTCSWIDVLNHRTCDISNPFESQTRAKIQQLEIKCEEEKKFIENRVHFTWQPAVYLSSPKWIEATENENEKIKRRWIFSPNNKLCTNCISDVTCKFMWLHMVHVSQNITKLKWQLRCTHSVQCFISKLYTDNTVWARWIKLDNDDGNSPASMSA